VAASQKLGQIVGGQPFMTTHPKYTWVASYDIITNCDTILRHCHRDVACEYQSSQKLKM
jgi:hypothetical protein